MAYFTSNREGGKGKTDIYKVIIKEGIQDINGYVLEDISKGCYTKCQTRVKKSRKHFN